jgi:hypothetical protein
VAKLRAELASAHARVSELQSAEAKMQEHRLDLQQMGFFDDAAEDEGGDHEDSKPSTTTTITTTTRRQATRRPSQHDVLDDSGLRRPP